MSPTSYYPQQSKKSSIYYEQSLNFCIIVEWSIYRSIGIRSNIIYGLLVVEQSYEDQSQNLNTQFLSFGFSVILWTISIVNRSIHRTKHLFLFNLIRLYVNTQTIDQNKYDYIIYTI